MRSASSGSTSRPCCCKAIEEKRFLPVGSDKEVESDFQLIAGTNRDLRSRGARRAVSRRSAGAHQPVDLRAARPCASGAKTSSPTSTSSSSAHARNSSDTCALQCRGAAALSALRDVAPRRSWTGNFRELSASITRMATLAEGGRITVDDRARGNRAAARDLAAARPTATCESLLSAQRSQRSTTSTACS